MNTYEKSGKPLAEFYRSLGVPKEGTKRFAPALMSVKQGSRENTHVFVISTNDEDREGDILEPKGAIIDNYMKNPVVLWAHDYWGLPIGRSLFVKPQARMIRAEVEWAPTDFAQQVRLLVDTGFLKGASVGFDPKEWVQRDDMASVDQYGWTYLAYHFTKWELLEWSAVAVPCNPMALIEEAKSMGHRVDVIESALKHEMRRGVVVPGLKSEHTTDLEEGEEEEDEDDKKPKPQPSAAPYPAVGHADTIVKPSGTKDGGPPVMQEADGTCRDAEGVAVPCGDFKPQPGGNQNQGKTKDGGPPVLQEADGTCRDAEGVAVPCGDFKPQPGGNQNQGKGPRLGKPFGEYEDFDDCVSSNQDKDDPQAYCGFLQSELEGKVYWPEVVKKFWGRHLNGITITRDEMKGICPSCAEKMEKANIAKLTIKPGASAEIKESLCDKWDDPGWFDSCANSSLAEEMDDVLAFCAYMHNECFGFYPGEHGDEEAARPDESKVLEIKEARGIIVVKDDPIVIRVQDDQKPSDPSKVKLPVSSTELADMIKEGIEDAVKRLKGQAPTVKDTL